MACGGREAYRPVLVEINGLSGQVQRLVVQLIPESHGIACAAVSAETVAGLMGPHRVVWERGAERVLVLPSIDEPSATLTVSAEGADGRVLQWACKELTYFELEAPEVVIDLP